MGMSASQLDRLDRIAADVREGKLDATGVLSTGERAYVALAGDSMQLLEEEDYSIVQAVARLDDDDLQELVKRWRLEPRPKQL